MNTNIPPDDFGVESIDAEGNIVHYPTIKLAVAAGFDKRNILNCLAGKRDKHKGRQWRPATWTSAIPSFVARWMTNEVDEVPVTDERPLAKFEVNLCQVDHKYRGWLWLSGISVRDTGALEIIKMMLPGTMYWRSRDVHDYFMQHKWWLPAPNPPLSQLPVWPPSVAEST